MQVLTTVIVSFFFIGLSKSTDIFGVDCGENLVQYADKKWKTLSNSCCVSSASRGPTIQTPDGEVKMIYGITNNEIFYKTQIDDGKSWQGPIPGSLGIQDIDMTSDQTIVGVNKEGKLVTNSGTNSWYNIPGNRNLKALTVLHNDKILAVFEDGSMKIKDSLYARKWNKVQSPKGVKFIEVAQKPDKTIVGVTDDGKLLTTKEPKKKTQWSKLEGFPGSTCLKAVSFK